MKLINLLIKELNNCSLDNDFESRNMQKYVNLIVFFRNWFQKSIHVVVIMKFPDWVQVKKIYYLKTSSFDLYFIWIEQEILLNPVIWNKK